MESSNDTKPSVEPSVVPVAASEVNHGHGGRHGRGRGGHGRGRGRGRGGHGRGSKSPGVKANVPPRVPASGMTGSPSPHLQSINGGRPNSGRSPAIIANSGRSPAVTPISVHPNSGRSPAVTPMQLGKSPGLSGLTPMLLPRYFRHFFS